MKTDLLVIKDELKKYAKTISKLFAMDVGICDKNLIRITGSGPQKIGEKIRGRANKKTLETKETTVILNPREDEICSGCSEKDCCLEVLEISTPIMYEGKLIGLISLVSFDENQKKRVLENLKNYLDFVEQMAELISIRFIEYNESLEKTERENVLTTILNTIQKGVLRFNSEGIITSINNFALKKIESDSRILGKKIQLSSQNDFLMEEEIYKLKVQEKELTVLGKILPFEAFGKNEKIFIFDDMNKVNDGIRGLVETSNSVSLENIIGDSEFTKLLRERIKHVAPSKSTVLITGESGTGKELVARALHYHSSRRNAPFVVINCAAIPESLLESELFGYVRGAFTGADKNGRMGKFELANGGVIFLDEIGDMPLYLQAKILRVLQERKVTRVGSNRDIELDIRIIAATNVDLEKKILEKEFREDLYYRLKVIPFEIAPLRDRREDILPITKNLIKKYNRITEKYISFIDIEVEKLFLNYSWPGNIRELENVVEFMFNLSDNSDILSLSTVPEKLLENRRINNEIVVEKKESKDVSYMEDFQVVEKSYIEKALKIFGRDTEGKKKIADKMGIGLTTLYRKIQKYNI
ncbi:sigma 54-interacting transcriptional regulator [Cetobacterium sp. 2G large]|uniref:sigma-54-dependent Fis family transcriptional regulator n=1 Tax=Cetobacterium sp. 2G large TaxID=2759680 RepID=UPI00163C193C|nr:sigma 54-interacting transcriptional regulator [Cetobacterium sp. 2G large]MBC2852690.1 sigma 54-interacting transcriptional regulator [Cetobacterium sp. 2G large]